MPRATSELASSEDLVRMYLVDIGRHPLLRADQEVSLAKEIEAGAKAGADLDRAGSTLLAEKRDALERRRSKGDTARRLFIEANLRLVVAIARRFQGFGLPLLDLIQDGNIGLLRAVDKYDWRRGFKFSTYATWWIRQGIARGLADTSRTIRVPSHINDKLYRIRHATTDLTTKLGRDVTDEEVAAFVGMDVEIIRWARTNAADTTSLHITIGEDGETELQDFLVDETCEQPLDAAVRSRSAQELYEVIKQLKPRERRVLALRFGLVDGQARTLEQVGAEFKLTRERIRQIESRALAKLRHPMRGRILQDFAD
ncbi:MAG TPA: sigma-70 family RNA polymerase sigma factor [Actinomycetota bacterium]|nr:sigma-70 family RNA polymerase sigma factor [Actinomycetota bacterium]